MIFLNQGGKSESSEAALDMTAWMDFKRFFEQEEYKHIKAMQWERARKDGSLQVLRWKKDPKARRGWARDKRTCLLFNSNCEREGNDGT